MKYIALVALLLTSFAAQSVTFEELGDSDLDPGAVRFDEGIVRSVDFVGRKIVVGGYTYLVGPPTINPAVQVTLYGSSAGAFELLTAGMKVEVQYFDFGVARVAIRIVELAPDADIEH